MTPKRFSPPRATAAAVSALLLAGCGGAEKPDPNAAARAAGDEPDLRPYEFGVATEPVGHQ